MTRLRGIAFVVRLNRAPLLVVAVSSALLSAMLLAIARSLNEDVAMCAATVDAMGPACQGLTLLGTVGNDVSRNLFLATSLLPALAGAILGAAIVAREMENGTAPWVWSIAASRVRWLVMNAAPLFVFGIVSVGVVAVLADALQGAVTPGLDPAASMENYGARGVPLLGRFMVAFALACLAGGVIPRALPALVIALAATLGLLAVAGPLAPSLVQPVEIGAPQSPRDMLGIAVTDLRYSIGDAWLSEREMLAIDPELDDPTTPEPVTFGVPGRAEATVEAREIGIELVCSALLALAAAGALRRRLPA